ncbi:MAG: tetratricopeptide repeat protein, partial [Luteolibacter sp.]
MQQKHADLDRDIKAERNIANAVVAGQRTQLQALEKQLELKNSDLAKANETISGLVKELEESHASFTQLRTERDTLLQERDQMSALLKLNDKGRIQDLIEQNMGLAKNLREANEKVDRLNLDNNASKDSIIEGLRDLAIAKAQINKLQQDKRDQDKRLEELETRLKSEEAALTQGKASSDPAEVEVLRDIIKRQLRVQERRSQARDLLVAAAKDMGGKDERLAQAVKFLDGEEVELTVDEQRLLADKNADYSMTSPYAQDRETVGRNTAELNRDITVFERTAEKSFAAGRLLPTRELFEMIIEQHPGHIPALCKLGVVDLRLKDPTAAADTFRRAVELDGNNAYAHRMLGFSLMQMGNVADAKKSLKQALELAPDDAKGYMLLGQIAFENAEYSEAETNFKAAITADPVLSDPYINLALVCVRLNRIDAARDYYNQALDRGAAPYPSLEHIFAKP